MTDEILDTRSGWSQWIPDSRPGAMMRVACTTTHIIPPRVSILFFVFFWGDTRRNLQDDVLRTPAFWESEELDTAETRIKGRESFLNETRDMCRMRSARQSQPLRRNME